MGAGEEPARCYFHLGNSSRQPRLSRSIFSSFLAYVLLVMLVVAVALTVIFYQSFEHDTEQTLVAHAESLARNLDEREGTRRVSLLEDQLLEGIRLTLVDADGTVLFDSVADEASMTNHADRPEVLAAEESGEASVVRMSETVGTTTVYAAVLLSDGSVIRVSQTRRSLASFLADAALPLLIALVGVALSALVLSRWLAARIVRPLDEVDLSDSPHSGAAATSPLYAEMAPMIERINDQRRRLEVQNRELAEAANMRRDFSANVSHEMKTPLQVISGYAELMQNGLVDGEDVQEFSQRIYNEAQSMRALIDDVLTLSQLDECAENTSDDHSSWVEVDLLHMAQQVRRRLLSFAEGYRVTVSVAGDSVSIRAHETLLEQAVFNLVENGIRYNRPGGVVTVLVGLDQDDPMRMQAVVRVSDTGCGIPPDQRERVFERFYRLEQSRSKETGGTGLGLAIVKHAALYHNGTVRLESSSSLGSVFELRLPM